MAPAGQVEKWLGGAAYERVADLDWGPAPARTDMVAGSGSVSPPGQQQFWAASVSGSGDQTLIWPTEPGSWTVVLMNADADPGVAADVSVGADTDLLLPVG